MKKLFFLFFLTSCTSVSSINNTKNHIYDFDKNFKFDEFKRSLIEYAKSSPFPNIDK